jgi:hypothetical protein
MLREFDDWVSLAKNRASTLIVLVSDSTLSSATYAIMSTSQDSTGFLDMFCSDLGDLSEGVFDAGYSL